MPRDRFVTVIRARVEIGRDLALNDDLRAGIGIWLQQHRVHVAHGVEPAGLRLHRLGAADFAAVGGHGAVQRHILRFERRHAHAAALKPAAQGGHQRALAGVRGRALDHEDVCGHG